MRKLHAMVMTVSAAIAACGGGEEVPSCQQAVSHYYSAGCRLVELSSGQAYSEAQVISDCKQLLAAAPSQCQDELDDLRSCFGGVPSPVAGNADCDCTSEQDAILTCE